MTKRVAHAWAAGFVDGEGYLHLAPVHGRKSDGYRHRKPVIQVVQTVEAPLLKLQRLFGGTVHELKQRPNRRRVWGWRLCGAAAVQRALKLMLPSMQVKKADAKILLSFIKLMNVGRKAGRPYVLPAQLAARERLQQQLLQLRR